MLDVEYLRKSYGGRDVVADVSLLCVRPEAISVVDGHALGPNRLACTLLHSGFVGGRWQHACTFDGARSFQMYTQNALNRGAVQARNTASGNARE